MTIEASATETHLVSYIDSHGSKAIFLKIFSNYSGR